MGQYCFARWVLPASSVTLPAGGPPGAWAANTARRASKATSRYGDTVFVMYFYQCRLGGYLRVPTTHYLVSGCVLE